MKRTRYTVPVLSAVMAVGLVGAITTTADATSGTSPGRPPAAARAGEGPVTVPARAGTVVVARGQAAIAVAGSAGSAGGEGACPVPGALSAPPPGPGRPAGVSVPVLPSGRAPQGSQRVEVRDGVVYLDGKRVATLPDGGKGPVLIAVQDGKVLIGKQAQRVAPAPQLPPLPAVASRRAGKAVAAGKVGKAGTALHLICAAQSRPGAPAGTGGSTGAGGGTTGGSAAGRRESGTRSEPGGVTHGRGGEDRSTAVG